MDFFPWIKTKPNTEAAHWKQRYDKLEILYTKLDTLYQKEKKLCTDYSEMVDKYQKLVTEKSELIEAYSKAFEKMTPDTSKESE